ncbi:MAG: hypothetical protein HY741_20675 [Chloroflexi bacterium]|nr:hypothetical protein [Chloroflexota bacterium]
MFNKTRIYSLIILLLLMSVLVTGVALAQGGLPHFVPREIENFPSALESYISPSAQNDSMGISALEQQVGFSILLPTNLPSGCHLRGTSYDSVGNAARLHYSCATIIERKATHIDHPLVAPHSTHQVLVGGEPALVIDGMWEDQPNGRTTWSLDLKTLGFERSGLVIRMVSGQDASEDQLIEIAKSMK